MDTRACHIRQQRHHLLEIVGVQAGLDENRVRLDIGPAARGVLHPIKQGERLSKAAAPAVSGDKGRVGLEVGGAALVEHGREELVRLLRLLALAEHGDVTPSFKTTNQIHSTYMLELISSYMQ